MNKQRLILLFTGFVQVFFIAINTYFLSRELYIGVLMASFMISMVWSFNIKKIAFGSMFDRIIYSIGATLGSLFGLYISSEISKFL